MLPVVGHVVAGEGQHGERVVAQRARFDVRRSSRHLRSNSGTDENAVVLVVSFGDQRNVRGATTTEQDRVDRNTLGCFPFFGDNRALPSGRGEAAVRVGRGLARLRRPLLALPVDQVIGSFFSHPFPPDVTIVSQRHVGEDRVCLHGFHCHWVGLVRRPRRNAEETSLRVDRVEATVFARTHPGDVIANGLNLVAGDGRLKHGKVCLTAS